MNEIIQRWVGWFILPRERRNYQAEANQLQQLVVARSVADGIDLLWPEEVGGEG